MVIVNPGTGPIAGTTLANARHNVDRFVAEVTDGLVNEMAVTATSIEHSPVDMDQQQADGRYDFTAHLTFANGGTCALKMAMPGLPLEQVAYGAEAGDRTRDFPRMYLDGQSWLWLQAVHLGRGTVRRAAAPDDRYSDSATFLYHEGLPLAAVAAAWGCRAIVNSSGMVDILPDRQGCFGDNDQRIDALVAQLNGGLNTRWKDRAGELLRDGTLRGEKGNEVVLLDADGVRVVANTKGSAGYLYVVAYTKPEAPTA